MIRTYQFDERLKMSNGVQDDISSYLLQHIPGATGCRKAEKREDLHGTDLWLDHIRGTPISVDVKVRDVDYAAKPKAADDLALEIWSKVETQAIGWTRDRRKRTDFVLWVWKDTKRFCLIPFPMLCHVFSGLWEQWVESFQTDTQATLDVNRNVLWHSQCVFVPRTHLLRTINHFYSPEFRGGRT